MTRLSRLTLISFMCLVYTVLGAQELEFIDLGVVEGEFRTLHKEVAWVNTTHEQVDLRVVSKSRNLMVSRESFSLAVGDTAHIAFEIALAQRPGYYEYEIQLLAGEDFLLHGMQFGLQVLAAEIDVFRAYRNIHWPFRAKENVFNLQAGYKGDTLRKTFDVFNLSGENLSLENVQANDSTWVTFEPKLIKHNQFGHMTIAVLSGKKAPSGFQRYNLELINEGKTLANLPIQFTLLPPPVQADSVVHERPIFTSSLINHDFKEVKKGQVREVEVVLANVGNAELVIEQLETNCTCLTYSLAESKLQPGSSTVLTVTFDATNRSGLEKKTLAVFTNDPNNPTQVLTFRAHVK
ncbi:DUF1573 domain-containing protein [Roseivirga sp. UBA1976]|uniref:DUF1573 domain-containing protein n=1 Tax=Roseivirga sp. UBA1976 TaxID=1947386 RepID=UPI00257D390C|nr:DUF1573 domain-containing protein [Roseivirga sp. UBA1976]MEC7755520.1 DUF1573 domain-containing protein [Bacteroidota bacterium]